MAKVVSLQHFDSWGEYVDRADSPKRPGMSSRNDSHMDSSWSGEPTWAAALKLAREGWQRGASRLDNLTARLEGRLANVSAVKRLGFDVMGPGTLDVGRYLIGHPESMMVWRESEELTDLNPARVLRVITNQSTNASMSDEQVFWRGAACCAIVDLAERAGVRCEVELVNPGRHSGTVGGVYQQTREINRVMLKRPQDALAPELMAVALCHPLSERRINFAVMEHYTTEVWRQIGGGYGAASELEPDEYEAETVIYVPSRINDFYSADSTAAWVVAELAKHEIEVVTDEH